MYCDNCERLIDPETDRHLLVTEELVAPDLGLEANEGQLLCERCMDPQVAQLAPK